MNRPSLKEIDALFADAFAPQRAAKHRAAQAGESISPVPLMPTAFVPGHVKPGATVTNEQGEVVGHVTRSVDGMVDFEINDAAARELLRKYGGKAQ